MRIGPSPRRTQARFSALLSAVLIAGVPATALAGPADRYYERSFVVAALVIATLLVIGWFTIIILVSLTLILI